MALTKTVSSFAKVLEPTTRVVHSVGMGVLAVMMFLTGIDVILRYVFTKPIPGGFELQEFMMGIVVALGVGYCAYLKGHINVDVIITRLPRRVQAFFNVFHYLVASVLFALVCWRTIVEGLALHSRGVTSSVLLLPILPFYCVVTFGSAMLCLAFLYNSLESLSIGVNKWNR